MYDDEVVILRFIDSLLDGVVVRGRIEQARAGNHAGGIREPGRIPKRPDLAGGLISRTRASIEILVGRRVEEHGLHKVHIYKQFSGV